MKKYTLRLTQTALLASVALVLSAIEMMIPPLPFILPGIKLGLSNIVVMFSLVALDLPTALFICLVKAAFVLLTRGVVAFLMSFSGGVLSALVMFFIISIKKPSFGYIGVGIAGAFFHNFGQILSAFIFTDKTVFAYLPVLTVSAIITGSITALVVSILLPPIVKTKLFKSVY